MSKQNEKDNANLKVRNKPAEDSEYQNVRKPRRTGQRVECWLPDREFWMPGVVVKRCFGSGSRGVGFERGLMGSARLVLLC